MIQTVSELVAAIGEHEIHLPVLIRKYSRREPINIYPREIFRDLKWDLKVAWGELVTMERRRFLKELIDLIAHSRIGLSVFHFGFYCLYGDHLPSRYEGDFATNVLGNKRFALYADIPTAEYVSNDDFIAETWASLVRRKEDRVAVRRNPYLSNVRILFHPDKFADISGRMYYDVEWVEPLSGKYDYECRTYGREG